MVQSEKVPCLSYWHECPLLRATSPYLQPFAASPRVRYAEDRSDPASKPSPCAQQVPGLLHWFRQSQRLRRRRLQTAADQLARIASLYHQLTVKSYDNSNRCDVTCQLHPILYPGYPKSPLCHSSCDHAVIRAEFASLQNKGRAF